MVGVCARWRDRYTPSGRPHSTGLKSETVKFSDASHDVAKSETVEHSGQVNIREHQVYRLSGPDKRDRALSAFCFDNIKTD
jgi:hypothetical protein